MPLLRYVDDYFGVGRRETTEHMLSVFMRLVEVCLGKGSLQKEKTDCGSSLAVLGLLLKIMPDGLQISVDSDKREQWLDIIQGAIDKHQLSAGTAGKLVGKLGFGTQFAFGKRGRAMLRPIYRQQYAPLKGGFTSELLISALRWWRRFLYTNPVTRVRHDSHDRDVAHVFTDAAGETRRICAMVFSDNQWHACDMQLTDEFLNIFSVRNDEQILGLELVAVLLAIHTFSDLLADKAVFFHIDNESSVHILRNGAARAEDHNLLSYSFWTSLCDENINGWLEWVPSHLNIADGPTRCSWEIYDVLRARVRPAILDQAVFDLSTFISDMQC